MLSILLIYYIGNRFYTLAEEQEKHQWGFAILGVVVFYLAQFFLGIVLLLVFELILDIPIDSVNTFWLDLAGIPFGIFACYLLLNYLRSKWENPPIAESNPEILDDLM